MTDVALVFDCAGDSLVGLLAPAESPATVGVLILVGGRQYRAGSHRQFVLLARRLARSGYSTFRFDVRGMGDSDGPQRSFEQLDTDIAAAIKAFSAQCPTVTKIVLWGLCDAATAAVLYRQRTGDPRIAGLCLVNPWFRSEAGLARTRVRYYYLQRVLSADFWRKFRQGRVGVIQSLREYFENLRAAKKQQTQGFQRAMLDGLGAFRGPVLLLLSGRDLTAKEFIDGVSSDPVGAAWLRQDRLRRLDFADADHTFSRQTWRDTAEEGVINWLNDQQKAFALVDGAITNSIPIPSAKKTRLLFVCMGNICRSPTAHCVVQAHLDQAGLSASVEVDSAGTHVQSGQTGQPGRQGGRLSDPRARAAASRRGYDMSALRGRRVVDADFVRFDRILAMDKDNLAVLRRRCPPEHQQKLGLLLDYSRKFAGGEVPDPYYGSDAGFDHVLDLIEDAASGLIESMRSPK